MTASKKNNSNKKSKFSKVGVNGHTNSSENIDSAVSDIVGLSNQLDKIVLPIGFMQNCEKFLGTDESGKLFAALDTASPVSIRFNPYKLNERPEGRTVPWSRYGYYLDERPIFTVDPLFHGGVYYVQEASSMFIETVFRQCFPEEGDVRVLDLCAAPGGKTTLLSTLVGAEGLVVANEVIKQRAAVLADNVKKWGIGNVVVTNNDPAQFEPFENYFDMVLVDAPCSGEGMFRKDMDARREWSEGNVKLCAARGQRILSDIWGSLKPGGIMIYSTCTFNSEENEKNIEWLVSEYDCEPVVVEIDPAWNIVKGEVEGINTFRFYPHKVEGEGFFCAVLRKGGGGKQRVPKPRKTIFTELTRKEIEIVETWVGQPEYMRFLKIGDNIYGYYGNNLQTVRQIAENMTVIYSGVLLGQIFGNNLRPEHPLAMFHDVRRENVPEIYLDDLQILAFLRKGDVPADLFEEGINMVCYKGLPLGWVKRIGARINNMYPKEMRIVNL